MHRRNPGSEQKGLRTSQITGLLQRAARQALRGSGWGAARLESLENRQLLTGSVVISEIMYHPGYGEYGQAGYIAENPSEEYVELYNRGDAPVNVEGWRLHKAVDYTFPATSIDPGAYLVVAADVNVFKQKHPGVSNVIGGWTGRLADSGDDLELEDSSLQRVDFVPYSNQGDWATHGQGEAYPGHSSWWRGWDWSSSADAGGRSLELINPAMPNDVGQNWAASLVDGGTPGLPNSVASDDIAPIITNVRQSPAVPGPTDPVTVTAKITDELPVPGGVSVNWRVDGAASFTAVTMYDDGQHGDGEAGDGVWGGVIPAQATNPYIAAQANSPVVEFYVEASDSGGKTRSWPAPTDAAGTHGANALYQVDPGTYGGSQPMYRLIVTEADRAAWTNLQDNVSSGRYSDAAMNGTLVAIDGTGTEVRYNVLVRNRGAGTRAFHPHNYRVDISNDHPLKGLSSIDLNTAYTQSQVAGNAVFAMAGLPAPYGAPVQVRLNGVNQASSNSPQFGSYYLFEPYNSEWAQNHFPQDPNGNIYKGVWYFDGVDLTNGGANLKYLGDNPVLYRQFYSASGPTASAGAYTRQTNNWDDNWQDLIDLTKTFDTTATPDSAFLSTLAQRVNIDEWLRYIAVNTLIGNKETTIATGAGDDYSMYRGVIDPRFQLLIHDLDTVLGQGDSAPSPTASIFQADSLATMARILHNPELAPRYFAVVKALIDTTFSAGQMNPLLDQVLGGWVAPATITAMKNFVAQRISNILNDDPMLAQIPLKIGIASTLTQQDGYYHTTSATTSLSGKANAIDTRYVLVNGVEATWTAWKASWTASNIALNPGINRVVVQALDASGKEIDRSAVDIWYDKGSVTTVPGGTLGADTTWKAADGPFLVNANLTIPAGRTLTIEPGTTVYFASGAGFVINGRLVAQGTDSQRIRFTRQPGSGVEWAGFQYTGATAPNVLAYADIEYAGSRSNTFYIKGSQILIDHITTANLDTKTFDIWEPQFTLRNSVFGDVGAHYQMTVEHMLSNGWYIVDGNLFGTDTGDNDIMHLNRVSVKGGPVATITNNVFLGAGDDIVDDNETDTHIEGNLFMRANIGNPGRSASAAVTTGPGGSTGVANLTTQHLTVVRNIFFENDYGILSKTGAYTQAYNNIFVGNRGAFLFDEPWRTDSGPGRQAYVEGCIFWNNQPENDDAGGGTFVYVNNTAADGHTQLTVNNSIVLSQFHKYGTGNIDADPMFARPSIDVQLNAGMIQFSTGFPGFAAGGYLLGHGAPDMSLLPGSPALGNGFNHTNMGPDTADGATVAGTPPAITTQDSATLTVGGTDIAGYGYSITGPGFDGTWSNTIAELKVVSQITLSGTTATAVTAQPHGYSNGDVIEVLGAEREGYNGLFKIFNVTPNSFSYTAVAGLPDQLPPKDIWCRKPQNIELSGLANGTYTVAVVRKNSMGAWQSTAAPTSVSWTVDSAEPGHVLINEVLADNQGVVSHNGTNPDLIELYNDGGSPVDLSGMFITDNAALPRKFVFPDGTVLEAGQYLILYGDAFMTAGELHLGFGLKSEGDQIYLYSRPDALGNSTLVDSVVYGLQLPNYSIGRSADGEWMLDQPTLGSANVAVPVADGSQVKINEWLADEKVLFDTDFVELYNLDTLPAAIGGMYLTDNPTELPRLSAVQPADAAEYRLAPLSFIAGNGYTKFSADGNTSAGADQAAFNLSVSGGMLGLFDAGMKLVDQVLYLPQSTDVSQGRNPLGSSKYSFETIPTPGIENTGVTTATVGLDKTTNIFDFKTNWRYNQSDNLDTANWKDPSYDDTTGNWKPGTGLFYAEPNVPSALRGTPLTLGRMTYYFRTHFTYNGTLDANTRLLLSAYVDDGAVVWLNGHRVYSLHMDPNVTPTYSTAASNHEFALEGPFELPTTWLQPGDNVLAVEVHQVNSTSTDVVWGAQLDVKEVGISEVVLRDVSIPANVQNLMQSLRITELMYDPIGDNNYEYIELQNTSATDTLDLSGVRITNGVDFVFPQSTLAPGQYVLVAANKAAFESRYGTGLNVAGEYAGRLYGSSGDSITLNLPAPYDAAVLRFSYSASWYPAANDLGKSLVIVDASAPQASWSAKESWQASSQIGGSPGRDNFPRTVNGTAGNDEFYLRTNGPDLEVYVNADPEAVPTPQPSYVFPLNTLSSLEINGGEGDDRLTILSSLPFLPTLNGSGNDAIVVKAGTYELAGDLGAKPAGTLSLTAAGTAVLNLLGSQHLAGLTVQDSAHVGLAGGGTHVLSANGLTLSGDGTLDLGDNDMILTHADTDHGAGIAEQLRNWLRSALVGGGEENPWTGTGLTSSKARDNENWDTAIAVFNNDDGEGNPWMESFNGIPIDQNSIILKYTYFGDANADGQITADDFAATTTGWFSQMSGIAPTWMSGDYNYDGKVTADDFAMVTASWFSQDRAQPLAVAEPEAVGPAAEAAPTLGVAAEGRFAAAEAAPTSGPTFAAPAKREPNVLLVDDLAVLA